MGSRRAVVFLTALALALAGCGGDDDDDDGSGGDTGGDTEGEALAQDRQARSDLRNLAAAVEACFVDGQDYTRCTDPPGAGRVGNAEVAEATAFTYTIVAPSESGNEFRLVRGKNGSTARECSEPGRAGCGGNGLW